MTEEEIRGKMEFIIEQQARFAAGIQQLKELHRQAEVRSIQSEVRMAEIEKVLLRLERKTDGFFGNN